MTSFHTLGTRLGPGISLAPPPLLCSVKEAQSLSPSQLQPEHRAQRRSRKRPRRGFDGAIDDREHGAAFPDWKIE
jgi:hypothetical protein